MANYQRKDICIGHVQTGPLYRGSYDVRGQKRAKSDERPLESLKQQAISTSGDNSDTRVSKRPSGNIKATRKVVTAEGDSDDEIIWEMKSRGFSDLEIRDRLVAEGRTQYSPKTISTRYSRIKKAKAAAIEKQLESDFEDYLEQDDEALRVAVAITQESYEGELAEVKKRRWDQIAEIMNTKLPQPKFTSYLAEQRWDALNNGTAIVPLEEDSNPDARIARIRAEKTKRRQEQEAIRLRCQSEQEQEEQALKEIADAKAALKDARIQARAAKESVEQARKIDRERKREALERAQQAENDRRTAVKLQQTINRNLKAKEKADAVASRAWVRNLISRERHQQTQRMKLEKSQKAVDCKAALMQEQAEEVNRRDLIRRHMRAAGSLVNASVVHS